MTDLEDYIDAHEDDDEWSGFHVEYVPDDDETGPGDYDEELLLLTILALEDDELDEFPEWDDDEGPESTTEPEGY